MSANHTKTKTLFKEKLEEKKQYTFVCSRKNRHLYMYLCTQSLHTIKQTDTCICMHAHSHYTHILKQTLVYVSMHIVTTHDKINRLV